MATIEDFRAKLKQIEEAVRARLPEIATTLTLSAKALSERRIKEKGFSEIYSTTRIPAWFLHGKELNKSGSAFLEKKQKQDQKNTKVKDGVKHFPSDYGTNWGEFRAAQGLQVAHVDLSYSNKMWANMQPLEPVVTGDIVRAPLGATNTEAQNKMNWNRDRYGDFVGKSLSPDDFNILGDVVIAEIVNIIELT